MSDSRPVVIVEPTVEPITVDEAIQHLNLNTDLDAAGRSQLSRFITSARSYCEMRTSRAFYKQTLQIGLDDWPVYYCDLPRATPLINIVSVRYRNWTDGIFQTLDTTSYYADTETLPGRFVWNGKTLYPIGALLAPSEPIQIQYVAGIDPNASPVTPFPELLKTAMLMLIADWFMNREAEFVSNPAAVASAPVLFGVDNILDRYIAGDAY